MNVNDYRPVGLDISEYGRLIIMKYFQCDVVIQEQTKFWKKAHVIVMYG